MVRKLLLVALAIVLFGCSPTAETTTTSHPPATAEPTTTLPASTTTTTTTIPTHGIAYPEVELDVRSLTDDETPVFVTRRSDGGEVLGATAVPGETDMIDQAPFSGSFSMTVPDGDNWLFNPQYNGIVAVPRNDPFSQGDFQWSLATGASILSPGMRVEFTEEFDRSALANPAVVPDGCATTSATPVSRGPHSGEEQRLSCGDGWLYLGYLEVDGGFIVYSVAEPPNTQVVFLLDALGTIHRTENASPVTDRDAPVHVDYWNLDIVPERTYYAGLEGAYPVDIAAGDLGGSVALHLDVLSSPLLAIRNFDDIAYELAVDGEPLLTLPARSVLTIDVDQFATEMAHLTFGSGYFAGYGLTVDMTRRVVGPPIEMYANSGDVDMEERYLEYPAGWQGWGVDGILMLIPAGWQDLSDPDRIEYRFVRGDQDDDPAEIRFWPRMALNLEGRLNLITREAKVHPVHIDTVSIRGETWDIYHWAPAGHPAITAVFVRWSDVSTGFAMLTSSPADHTYLFETALMPLVETFLLVPADY